MYIYVCETHKMNASWASYIIFEALKKIKFG